MELEDSDSRLCSMPDDGIVPALSEPFGHLQGELHSLNTKVDKLESSISKSVPYEIKSSIPSCVADAIKEKLHGLLKEALKACLLHIHESIQQTIQQFVTLQKELSKVIKTKMGKPVKAKVRKGIGFVFDQLASVQSLIATNSQHVTNNPESPAQKENAQNPDLAQGEQKSEDAHMANIQGEQPTAHQTTTVSSVADTSKKKDLDDEPPAKKLKFIILTSSIPSPIPPNSILPEPIPRTEITKMSFDQFSEHLT
ncbi:hypothetical protein Tco_0265631 [Tanacetum coccineum]